ncbi:TetR/AcrR family transcriptional regulator [Solimicrobium silvestre]|uniref:Bacterial regulatory protein, tetR family n=1 Tax=Solimicrobium silvestre TaxID=2099400 RepID=A0A2S9GVM3_9BURK|nr:TetR/AcrR family transcriptional regulator [Solimicrobium silvestre]PRC91764.1 Bacterial regulatory protein, tetR family [Solimicrobium silvestre]
MSQPSNPRERILLTAHDLFYRDGIRATGIDRVIAESGVAKATFYKYFPSKNDLIYEFLEYRHQYWMTWFVDALQRHGDEPKALTLAMAEWFANAGFRGCAFINSVAELGGTLPEVLEISRRHKQEMTETISKLLPPSRHRKQDAAALSLAVDGAIIRAQCDPEPDAALASLELIRKLLMATPK